MYIYSQLKKAVKDRRGTTTHGTSSGKLDIPNKATKQGYTALKAKMLM